MVHTIANRKISRIHIIDDNEVFRGTLEDTIVDSDFEPLQQNGAHNIEEFLRENVGHNDAIVTDHHLMKGSYFPVNGAEITFMCYDKKIPSLLVTKYETYISDIRRFRHKIPVILNPEDFEPDTLIQGLEICINEFNGKVRADRKGWRTLLRIDSTDEAHIYVLIPAWNPNEIVMLNKADLPSEIVKIAVTDHRLHAVVNVGAELSKDLYFTQWEPK